MKREDRRRRGGNVGIRRSLPDFQARREGWKTRSGSFPRFPRRGISTATPSLLPLGVCGGARPATAEVIVAGTRASREFFPQEVKE